MNDENGPADAFKSIEIYLMLIIIDIFFKCVFAAAAAAAATSLTCL